MSKPKKLKKLEKYDFERIKAAPRRSVIRLIFSRFCVSALLMALQVLLMVWLVMIWSQKHSTEVLLLFIATVSTGIFIVILNGESNPTYKISWIIPVAVLPVFGSLLYLLFHYNIGSITSNKSVKQSLADTEKYTHTDPAVRDALRMQNRKVAALSEYIENAGAYPTYRNTGLKYFPSGEDAFPEIIRQLKKAERFIFLEFFIIAEGLFWNTILDVLEEKVNEGVEVRVMYDDIGCMSTLPRDYTEQLKEKGINAKVFAKVTPFFSTHYNNRDHRKIIVIDGKAAFSGGINLADEYINREYRFGKWKDNCFLLEGDAVRSYTLMFLQLWNTSASPDARAYQPYLNIRSPREPREGDGFVIPYGDGPQSAVSVAESVYLSIINSAVDYVHIMTPYLVLDDEMLNTLKRSAKSGVDVRILLPHIPDKKSVNLIAKTYYRELLEAGVHIYEYTPGFIHSKVVEADGSIAAMGTINMDFRSLYLHYECASVVFENDVLLEITNDFQRTFADSHRVTISDYRRINIFKRIAGRVLRIFAPLV